MTLTAGIAVRRAAMTAFAHVMLYHDHAIEPIPLEVCLLQIMVMTKSNQSKLRRAVSTWRRAKGAELREPNVQLCVTMFGTSFETHSAYERILFMMSNQALILCANGLRDTNPAYIL